MQPTPVTLRAHRRPPALLRALALACLAGAVLPAWALYKVVGPDGSVTYTDRPPPGASSGRVTAIGGADQQREVDTAPPAGTALTGLPIALRQVAARYPVTIYVMNADCPPCDGARRLLRDRGVPYAERLVETDDDARALERLVGARTVPSITIGPKAMGGLNPDEWNAYIDAAGYPRGALPANWKPAAATPLAGRPAAGAAAAEPAPAPLATGGPASPLPAAPAAPPPAATPGFRF